MKNSLHYDLGEEVAQLDVFCSWLEQKASAVARLLEADISEDT